MESIQRKLCFFKPMKANYASFLFHRSFVIRDKYLMGHTAAQVEAATEDVGTAPTSYFLNKITSSL